MTTWQARPWKSRPHVTMLHGIPVTMSGGALVDGVMWHRATPDNPELPVMLYSEEPQRVLYPGNEGYDHMLMTLTLMEDA